ncbi:MAG: ComF family protein [Actinomycetales bacterium]|nr:ComF family protein [Actinomycetales bacterium]
MTALRAALAAALDLVTPTACPGCGHLDVVLCERCAAPLYGVPRRVDAETPFLHDGPPTWAATTYTDSTREVVLAWKRGREDLRGTLREAAGELVDRWAALGEGPVGGVVGIVPAPSGWVRRVRGLLVVRDLAETAAAAFAAARPGVEVRALDVVRRRGTGHLAGLGAGARAAARGTAVMRVRAHPPVDAWVVVDDVVTTGATLRAVATALRQASGRPVVAAFVLAATPRRSAAGM